MSDNERIAWEMLNWYSQLESNQAWSRHSILSFSIVSIQCNLPNENHRLSAVLSYSVQ
jgi:hypothetical protein